mmetsp:Transcript_93325/g.263442  ORF Transcript_93325/g.263442 Transcript_93325/m.263442 type:complete len:294 (+) Transcript_93325:385-1266(+)
MALRRCRSAAHMGNGKHVPLHLRHESPRLHFYRLRLRGRRRLHVRATDAQQSAQRRGLGARHVSASGTAANRSTARALGAQRLRSACKMARRRRACCWRPCLSIAPHGRCPHWTRGHSLPRRSSATLRRSSSSAPLAAKSSRDAWGKQIVVRVGINLRVLENNRLLGRSRGDEASGSGREGGIPEVAACALHDAAVLRGHSVRFLIEPQIQVLDGFLFHGLPIETKAKGALLFWATAPALLLAAIELLAGQLCGAVGGVLHGQELVRRVNCLVRLLQVFNEQGGHLLVFVSMR